MANYYRRFIPNFSTISYPLTYLRKKRVQFNWSNDCENAFQQIKKLLISSPILAYPDFTKQFKVVVDASQLGCGAIICQDHDGSDLPISFISRTFKKGETNKAIIEKELIAIHFALKTFRHYLYGQNFLVYTDHKPLIYLFKLKNPSSKLMRIKMDLEEFDFKTYQRSRKRGSGRVITHIDTRFIPNVRRKSHIQNRNCSIRIQTHKNETEI